MRRLVFACVTVAAAASARFSSAQPYEPDPNAPYPSEPYPSEPYPSEPYPSEAPPTEPYAGDVGDYYADTDPSALTDFRSVLDPYGSWVVDPTYGQVWIPDAGEVGYDFVPYQTGGRWEYDGNDYVWASDYSWGWVPFHYGRWVYSDVNGWVWVPGRAYAPAWVDWRVGDQGYNYVGWAPTPPYWGWYGGFAVGLSFAPSAYYSYVPSRYVFDRHIHRHVVYGNRFATVEDHTRPLVRPSIGARPVHMRGPAPRTLGRDVRVVQVNRDQRGFTMARQYANPTTARRLGAKPPSRNVMRPPAAKTQAELRAAPPAGVPPKAQRPPSTRTEGASNRREKARRREKVRRPVRALRRVRLCRSGNQRRRVSHRVKESRRANPRRRAQKRRRARNHRVKQHRRAKRNHRANQRRRAKRNRRVNQRHRAKRSHRANQRRRAKRNHRVKQRRRVEQRRRAQKRPRARSHHVERRHRAK